MTGLAWEARQRKTGRCESGNRVFTRKTRRTRKDGRKAGMRRISRQDAKNAKAAILGGESVWAKWAGFRSLNLF